MKLCIFSVLAFAMVMSGCSAPMKDTAEASNQPDAPQRLTMNVATEVTAPTATGSILDSMIPVSGCLMTRNGDVLQLAAPTPDRSLVQTTATFRPPFVFRLRAKTDSTNLRLYYNAGMVIFNWECRQDQLRVHDPLTNQTRAVPGKGLIAPGKWHDVIWEVYPDRMSITVDDENRYSTPGNYANIDAAIGVGPAFGSVVSIESIEVTAQ